MKKPNIASLATLENPSPALISLFHKGEWQIVGMNAKAQDALDRYHAKHDIFEILEQAGQFVIGNGSGNRTYPGWQKEIARDRRFLKKYACQLTLAPL